MSPASWTPRNRLRQSLGVPPGKLVLAASVAAVAIAAGSWYGAEWWTTGRFTVSTDDAYVRAHNTTLASKVSGYVASIPLNEQCEGACRRYYSDHR
jgi:multidrug resistance efflux pump